MKTIHVLLWISLLICSNLLIWSAAESPNHVLDIGGKKPRACVPYHIIASANGPGGMTFECSRNNSNCPVQIIKGDIGLPLYFTPVDNKKGMIRKATDLNIVFWYTSDVWKVDNYDRFAGKYFVTTGGIVGNPGPQTLSNWFKLEKLERGYKLRHCPSVCKNCKCKPMCKDVGIVLKNGKIRLALSDKPVKIFFREY